MTKLDICRAIFAGCLITLVVLLATDLITRYLPTFSVVAAVALGVFLATRADHSDLKSP